jgi:hypothetical protein
MEDKFEVKKNKGLIMKKRMEKLKKESNKVRYALHKKIKNQGYVYNPFIKTIYCYYMDALTNEVIRLRNEFGYSIQTQLVR